MEPQCPSPAGPAHDPRPTLGPPALSRPRTFATLAELTLAWYGKHKWKFASSRSTPMREHLPVMVWIYGGGYINGSASMPLYWGDRLAHKGVIVVTIGHRLGP